MTAIAAAAAEFREARRRLALAARQSAALQLSCGVDLDHALRQTGSARAAIVGRVRRAMRRERLRGVCGKPDYSLERHIALKRSLERLLVTTPPNENGAPKDAAPLSVRSERG